MPFCRTCNSFMNSKNLINYVQDNIIEPNHIILKELMTHYECELIDIDNLGDVDLTKSRIIKIILNNIILEKNTYKSLLDEIYNIIGDGATIIKKSFLNIITLKKHDRGFKFFKNLHYSIVQIFKNDYMS